MTTTPTPPEDPAGAGYEPVTDGGPPAAHPLPAAPPPTFPPPSFPQYGQQQSGQAYGQPYGDPYGGGFGAPPVQRRNGMGLAAMVLGIISIPGAITVWIGGICGVLALIFGIIGMKRAKQSLATNRGQALAGVICGAIGVVLSIIVLIFAVWVTNTTKDCNTYDRNSSDYTNCVRDKITNG